MKYQAENAVSSFFYYMWNAWSKEECKAVFGDMYRHFWDKWSALADKSIFGAAERFFAELSENNQKLLVERAVTLYDGRAFRKEPDDSDILVCKECGSRQLEIQAWINANTDERISYVHDDNNGLWCDGKWCEECGVQVFFCTKAEFTQKMQGWWESCGFETKEQITGLKVCDSPPSENTQTFIDAAETSGLSFQTSKSLSNSVFTCCMMAVSPPLSGWCCNARRRYSFFRSANECML